jgi:hypothetical protein
LKRKAIAAATAALAVALPGSAALAVPAHPEGSYLKRFRVADMGSQIRWGITICSSRRTRVRAFSATLDPESVGVRFTRSWGGGMAGAGCERWTMTARDVWTEQVWYSRLTVVMANGQLLRTPYQGFYIS